MTAYPIIDRRILDPAAKRGLLRRQARDGAELPRPDAHQVLVFRVNGQYVLDDSRMGNADERVVQATNVSLVDMRREAPVTVTLQVASKDASYFEVVTTFVCSVTDAVAVVRGGVDAQQSLWGYLKAHHKISELALRYKLAEVNEVRRDVGAQITAFTTIKPPSVSGMTVRLASVEVSTPKFLRDLEDIIRDRGTKHTLAARDMEDEQVLAEQRQRGAQVLAGSAQDHQHDLADRVHRRDGSLAVEDARLDRMLKAEQAEFERREFGKNLETLGHDPRRALLAAHVAGRIDAQTYSEQLQALDERDQARFLEQGELERAERHREEDRRHADQLRIEQWDREDRREMIAAVRDRERGIDQHEREDLLYDRDEQRRTDERRYADQLRLEQWDREDRRELIAAVRDQERDGERQRREDLQREQDAQRRKDEQSRADELRAKEWDREDRRDLLAVHLERERAVEQRRIEERQDARTEQRQSEQERLKDERQAAQWRHDNEVRREKAAREDALQQLQMKVDLLKQAAVRGHLDMVNLGLDKVYAEVIGTGNPQQEVAGEHKRGLTAAGTTDGSERDDDQKAQVREEDD